MNKLNPLDAVITGYAYENATLALGVLAGQAEPGSKISTEMLCTLDNFIKVFLFSDRVYMHPLHTEIDVMPASPGELAHYIRVSDYPLSGAGKEATAEFDRSGIFHLLPAEGFGESVEDEFQRTTAFLKNVRPEKDVWCVLRAAWPNETTIMWHEMVVYDLVFMDTAIHHCGLEHFKPVFPGEHFYLGLRGIEGRYQTIGDLAAGRLRWLLRKRFGQLNERQVTLGASALPVLSPIFVSRLLSACKDRTKLGSTLLRVRMSDPFRRFRDGIREWQRMLESQDINERSNSVEVLKMLNSVEFDDKSDTTAWVKHGFKVTQAIVARLRGSILDPLQEMFELSTLLFKSLSESALSMLNEFNANKNADPLDAFLKKNFGDHFDLAERHSIARLLSLPERAKDWQAENVSFAAKPGRIDVSQPPLSRPYWASTRESGLPVDPIP